MGKLEQYHQVMMNQINTGKLEAIPNQPSGNQVHYISHHVVFKENSKTTKLRIVYDCSSEESNDVPSFNDYLETGPPKLDHRYNRSYLIFSYAIASKGSLLLVMC